jgi:hypothetical protein
VEPVEIRGDGIDSARLIAALRARAARRPPVELPAADLDLPSPLPADHAVRLGAWLDRARRVAKRLSVDPHVGWRTPLLGPLWHVVRRVLYRDLRIYADAVASKQMVYNEAIVQALDLLVERLAALEEHLAAGPGALAGEVERLARTVAQLEARLATLERAARGPAAGEPGASS